MLTAQFAEEARTKRAHEQSIGRDIAPGPEIGLLIGENVTNSSALYVANAVDNP